MAVEAEKMFGIRVESKLFEPVLQDSECQTSVATTKARKISIKSCSRSVRFSVETETKGVEPFVTDKLEYECRNLTNSLALFGTFGRSGFSCKCPSKRIVNYNQLYMCKLVQ